MRLEPRCDRGSRAAGLSAASLRRIGEQRDAALRRRTAPRAAACRSSRRPSVSSRVLTLLASTSGWSNGSMPMIAPATAVAISQRKNSWPICVGVGDVDRARPDGRRARAPRPPPCAAIRLGGEPQIDEQPVVAVDLGRAERLAIDRHDALAVLAGRIRRRAARARRRNRRCPGEAMIVTLSRPWLRGDAEDGAERHARILRRRRARHARAHHDRPRHRGGAPHRAPIAAAGTRPKFDSTE